MDLLNLDEPDDNYWMRLGALPNNTESDAAIANYTRVLEAESRGGDSHLFLSPSASSSASIATMAS